MPDIEIREESKPSPPAPPVVTEEPQPQAGAESETQSDQSPEVSPKPPEKGGVQRRIDELTKARRLAEAEAEFWRQKALDNVPSPVAAAEKPKTQPNPGDFETTEEYLAARDTWVREETMRAVQGEFEKRDKAHEERSERESLSAEWSEQETAVQETHPDYKEVTLLAMDALQSSKGPATAAIAHAVQYSEIGPELLYYLGQHPEEVERLARLHPTQAVIGLGRIEGRLANENPGGEQKSPPQTRVPKPPTPIRGKGAVVDDKELRDDLPPEEWQRRFLKRMENK